MDVKEVAAGRGPAERRCVMAEDNNGIVTKGRKRWAAAAVVAAVVSANASATYAIFGVGASVVFDPENYAQNLRQLAEIAEQVDRVREQLENDLRALRRLGLSGAEGLLGGLRRVQGAMGSGWGGDAAGDLQRRYPQEYGGPLPPGTISEARGGWEAAERDALAADRATQDAVVADMPRASARVAEVVAASNAADGVTAAEQARNLLLAEANGEAGKLAAVRAARERARVERDAREQAEVAQARAKRGQVMADWSAAGTSAPVADPFGR